MAASSSHLYNGSKWQNMVHLHLMSMECQMNLKICESSQLCQIRWNQVDATLLAWICNTDVMNLKHPSATGDWTDRVRSPSISPHSESFKRILHPSFLTCRMSRKRKYVLATSWNCSNKLTGRKVTMLYLDVMMRLLWMKRRGDQMTRLKHSLIFNESWRMRHLSLTAYWNFSLYSLSLALTLLSSSARNKRHKARKFKYHRKYRNHLHCCKVHVKTKCIPGECQF